jgi:hypothetical protein
MPQAVQVAPFEGDAVSPETAGRRQKNSDATYGSGSGRASLAVHLVNKAPKEHFDGREPSHLGNVGQHRPLLIR